MTDPAQIAADLARVLAEDGPHSGTHLARRLRARKADTLCELRTNPAFERVGRGSSSVWRLTDSHQHRNRLGTTLEPLWRGTHAGVTDDLLDRVTALEKRLEALEHANGIEMR
jgi:hypothetical protein